MRFPGWSISLVLGLTSCGSSGSTGTASGGGPAGSSSAHWAGDPCSLLTSADFASITPQMTISTTQANNVGSATYSPECRFSLNGDGTSAAVGVFVDTIADFELQKSIFEGQPVTGLGKSAWEGNAGGPANSTVGVLLAQWSFRVDSTYEFDYAALKTLATAIAPRIK